MAYCGIDMTKLKYSMASFSDNRNPECKLYSYRHVMKVNILLGPFIQNLRLR